MGVLALKLLLAPSFVVATSLVARRHGPLVGGLVGGMPAVAGPILIVVTVVHGRGFGAEASSACVLGMVSLTAFAVVYAHVAPHMPWTAALVLGWGVFAAATAVIAVATDRPGVVVGLVAAFVSFGAGLVLMPAARAAGSDTVYAGWDLPLRAVAAAVMVVVITEVSAALGPELSGLIAPFPVITSVMAAFTHAQRGAGEAALILRGMLGGFYVYALLVFVYALALGAPL